MEPGILATGAGATVWQWENFRTDFITKLGETGKERWNRVKWAEAAERYRQHVLKDYGTMRILGMTEPVLLEGTFIDVYILDRPMALRRHNIEELQREPEQLWNVTRLPGLEVVKERHHLFIMGKPGAGKTTFLKYVALSAARGELDFVPIFVSLNAWANSKHIELLPYLAQEFSSCGFPDAQPFIESLLDQGKALVLFDGLDEVPQEGNRRADRSRLIHDFARQYHRCPCLITCRTAATDYTFATFTYVEIADFDDAQIKSFVNKWFRNNGTKRSQFTEEFYRDENRGLRELARTPLLLTLLCLAFDEMGYFPKRRVDLYEEALTALLQKWDSSRGILRDEAYKTLSPKRKRQMLARIAYREFERGDYFLREETLAQQVVDYLHHVPPVNQEEEIDGKAVLKAIEAQHGILIERARGIYSFSHLTFQEYFTALYIVENVGKGTLPKLMEQITNPRWREIFLLTASLLDDADDFFAFFIFGIENLIVGDETLVERLIWSTKKADDIISNDNTFTYRPAALRSLYLARTNTPTQTLDRPLDRVLESAFEFALNLDPKFDLAHVRTLDLALDLTLDLAHTRALERALDLAFDLALELVLELDINLLVDIHLGYLLRFLHIVVLRYISGLSSSLFHKLTIYFNQVQAYTEKLPSQSLHRSLASLTMPTRSDSLEAWEHFEIELRAILLRERGIGDEWNLNQRQLEQMESYLWANRLVLDCLDLAYISNRRAVEARLLLPPGHPAP